MWEGIDRYNYNAFAKDLMKILEGIKNNSLLWVRGDSYSRKRSPTISGAGWLVFCVNTGK